MIPGICRRRSGGQEGPYGEAGRCGPDAVAGGADDGTLVEVAGANQAVFA